MTYDEAKEKYKGLNIKAIDEKTGNSKGFFYINKTQYIYRSEITGRYKNSKNAYYVDGEVFLLPDPLKKKLQMHISKEVDEVPSGVDYDKTNERYNVKLSYLQLVKDEKTKDDKQKELVEPQEELKQETQKKEDVGVLEEDVRSESPFKYSNDLLDSAAAYLVINKVVEGSKFFLSLTDEESLNEQIQLEVAKLLKIQAYDLEKIIALLVVYKELRKTLL